MKEVFGYIILGLLVYLLLKPYLSLVYLENITDELAKIRKELEKMNK